MSATRSAPSAGRPHAFRSGIGRHPPLPGVVFDARRALFLEETGALVVADLHLGYAWAQRQRGLLMPVGTPDDAAGRLAGLVRDHAPRAVVVLGDLVHRAVAHPGVREELEAVCASLANRPIVLCPGNHDSRIETLLANWRLPITVTSEWNAGSFRLSHGDVMAQEAAEGSFRLGGASRRVSVIGHEHPAIELGDGALTRVKVPCFLLAADTVVLPAFSEWAAGCVVGRDVFLGPVARAARFEAAYACLGPRLLPVSLRAPLNAPGKRRKPAGETAPD